MRPRDGVSQTSISSSSVQRIATAGRRPTRSRPLPTEASTATAAGSIVCPGSIRTSPARASDPCRAMCASGSTGATAGAILRPSLLPRVTGRERRGPSRALRKEAANARGLGHAADGQDVGGHAHVDLLGARRVVHLAEGPLHELLQLAVDLRLL